MKTCSKCKKDLSIKEFHKDSTTVDKLYPSCKQCRNILSKKVYNEHRDSYYLSRYNITALEYKYYMTTSLVCQICGRENNLCYDHDHTSMKFRGVLCKICNKGLGCLGDNIEGITKALVYLKSCQ